jgi:carboxyl-terminal processing protease
MPVGRPRTVVIALSFFLVAFAGAGRIVGNGTDREKTYGDLGTFTEVLQLVNSSYVDPVDGGKLMVGACRGMLSSLDPQSGWLSPEEVKSLLADDAPRAGIGIETTKRGGYAFVAAVRAGSPAEKAGVKIGEYIRTIDGVSTREMSVFQVRRAFTGTAGSVVHLNLFGNGEGREVEVRRQMFESPAVSVTRKPGGILLVKVNYLDPTTLTSLRKALTPAPEGTSQLLLDLRNTVSGSKDDGVALADMFLTGGTIVRVESRKEEASAVQADPDTVWKGPLSLLVNPLSSGPVEIAVAALKENGRARILGQPTGGDASIQKLIRLPDQSAVILSVGRYIGPAGASWGGKGVVPDVTISARPDAAADGDEPDAPDGSDLQLERALDYLARGEQALKTAA